CLYIQYQLSGQPNLDRLPLIKIKKTKQNKTKQNVTIGSHCDDQTRAERGSRIYAIR
ncbi:MAG: hypothetical protein ACI909_004072, partial [Planctomycetota bacterium]